MTAEEQSKEFAKKALSLNRFVNLKMNSTNLGEFLKRGRITVDQLRTIRRLLAVAENCYPGMVDIQVQIEADYRVMFNSYGCRIDGEPYKYLEFKNFPITHFYIVIHFPELTITNGTDSRVLRDLFVRVPFTFNSVGLPFFDDRIEGSRTTLSITEYRTNYQHSHLPSRNYAVFDHRISYFTFCTGDADINLALSLANNDNGDFDEDQISLYLLGIKPYLEWESLEGGPYIAMSKMDGTIVKDSDIDESNYRQIYHYLVAACRQDAYIPDLTWQIDDSGKTSLILDNKFDTMINTINYSPTVSRNIQAVIQSLMFPKDIRGNFITLADAIMRHRQVPDLTPNDWIPFKGEKIFFKFIEDPNPNIVDRALYLHDKVKNYVKSKFEQVANEAQIRATAISRANTIGYI